MEMVAKSATVLGDSCGNRALITRVRAVLQCLIFLL